MRNRTSHNSEQQATPAGKTPKGSLLASAALAAKALVEAGATRLMIAYGAFVASYGECYRDDLAAQNEVRRPDGGKYHRNSFQRARRLMVQQGWLASRRVHVGQKLAHMRHASAHGTTNKAIRWKHFGLKSPVSRAEARSCRIVNSKDVAGVVAAATPRYSAAAPLPLPAGLAAVIGAAEAQLERRWQEQDASSLQRVSRDVERHRRERPPD